MAVFKCKMCGGDLEILDNATVCECEYCGTKQTLPKLDDEKRVQLYDRANYFRRENEFDKAMGIYEMILSEANDDAESYWGIVLCRYGIEYVEDPRTHRRIPTVNRAQFTSIFDDEDYKKAIQYADTLQKEVYEAEATVIDKIQKGILDISNKEDPFDVFICYKETDENGQRTKDSVYAQSIYDWLVKQGYKVFFSRITLEDKLGSAYEPYIFAALNSARVMLVVGTKKEHFNAVWVKNEWSRYLSLIKAGKEKTIIPVYKDISPYDLPEEFQYLQAQDMNKIGFSQDLGRGIRKLIPLNEPVKETVVVNQSQNNNVATLLERAFMFLEDGDWNSADEYCEKVLDLDPKNAEAYLGKLMVELSVNKKNELENCSESFEENSIYKKIVRFGDEKLVNELKGYIKTINARKLEAYYNQLVSAISNAVKKEDFEKIIIALEKIETYKDSKEKISFCKGKVEEILKEEEKARLEAEHKAEEERIAKEKAKKKRKKLVVGIPSGVVAIALAVVLLVTVIIPKIKFRDIIEVSSNSYYQTFGVKKDGSVVSTTCINFSPLISYADADDILDTSDWCDIVAISETTSYVLGLKSDGTVVSVYSADASFKPDVSSWSNIVAVSTSANIAAGVKSDGTVVVEGVNAELVRSAEKWKNIVEISVEDDFVVGLKSNGTVVSTRYVGDENFNYGQSDVSTWNDITSIITGTRFTIGLKSDGTLVATGYNHSGQLNVSSWTDIISVSGEFSHVVGLKSDGTVVAVGENTYGQCDVEDWTDIVAVSAGFDRTVGLKSDGTVVAVGLNWNGQCLVG